MELVIDIDEKTYKDIMDDAKNTPRNLSHYERIISKGNPIALESTSQFDVIPIDVLDKIRAEVTSIAINGQVDEHTLFIRTGEQVKQVVLEIIDKYKADGGDINVQRRSN